VASAKAELLVSSRPSRIGSVMENKCMADDICCASHNDRRLRRRGLVDAHHVCLCTFEMCVTIPLSPLISSSSSITVFKACANSTANIHYVQQFQHLTAPNLITASNMPCRPRGRHWRTYGPFVMQKCKVGLTHSEGRLLHNISRHKLSASVIAPLLISHFVCNACEL